MAKAGWKQRRKKLAAAEPHRDDVGLQDASLLATKLSCYHDRKCAPAVVLALLEVARGVRPSISASKRAAFRGAPFALRAW